MAARKFVVPNLAKDRLVIESFSEEVTVEASWTSEEGEDGVPGEKDAELRKNGSKMLGHRVLLDREDFVNALIAVKVNMKVLVIDGEVKSGKSMFINALYDSELLRSSRGNTWRACTRALNDLGLELRTQRYIPFYIITPLNAGSPAAHSFTAPLKSCAFTYLDLPGLGDNRLDASVRKPFGTTGRTPAFPDRGEPYQALWLDHTLFVTTLDSRSFEDRPCGRGVRTCRRVVNQALVRTTLHGAAVGREDWVMSRKGSDSGTSCTETACFDQKNVDAGENYARCLSTVPIVTRGRGRLVSLVGLDDKGRLKHPVRDKEAMVRAAVSEASRSADATTGLGGHSSSICRERVLTTTICQTPRHSSRSAFITKEATWQQVAA